MIDKLAVSFNRKDVRRAFAARLSGLVCLSITYLAISYAQYITTFWIILCVMKESPWSPIHLVLFNIMIFLLVLAHLKAVCTDTGVVHQDKTPDGLIPHGWSFCTKCEKYRPPRAHHCRICNKCILRMDHHCPWINNCVGEKNQKYFIQLLAYVSIVAVYICGLVIFSWTYPLKDLEKGHIHSVLLLLEATIYGLFGVTFFIEQIHAILKDQTAIETVQGSTSLRPNQQKLDRFSEVFGHINPLCWLLPCATSCKQKSYELSSHHV